MEIHKRINVCPLGSGAIAGNPFKVDREQLATGDQKNLILIIFVRYCKIFIYQITTLVSDVI